VLDRSEIQVHGLTGDPGQAVRNSDTPVLAWKARYMRTHRGAET